MKKMMCVNERKIRIAKVRVPIFRRLYGNVIRPVTNPQGFWQIPEGIASPPLLWVVRQFKKRNMLPELKLKTLGIRNTMLRQTPGWQQTHHQPTALSSHVSLCPTTLKPPQKVGKRSQGQFTSHWKPCCETPVQRNYTSLPEGIRSNLSTQHFRGLMRNR